MFTKIDLLFASFILQFTASMLGSKVQPALATVISAGKHTGCANSGIGYFISTWSVAVLCQITLYIRYQHLSQ